MALLSDGMARKSKLSRLLGDREPGLAHAALGGPPLALQQFQFGHAQQVARIVDIFGGALPGHPVVLTQEGGQAQRLQVMFEQDLRCAGGDRLAHADDPLSRAI
jgi:hypothetical protein